MNPMNEIDAAGNLVFVEMQTISCAGDAETGRIRTLAGTGERGFSGDGGQPAHDEPAAQHSAHPAGHLYL